MISLVQFQIKTIPYSERKKLEINDLKKTSSNLYLTESLIRIKSLKPDEESKSEPAASNLSPVSKNANILRHFSSSYFLIQKKV